MTSSVSITVTKCRHFSMGKYLVVRWGTLTSWSWDGNTPSCRMEWMLRQPLLCDPVVTGTPVHLPEQMCTTDSMGRELALCHVRGVLPAVWLGRDCEASRRQSSRKKIKGHVIQTNVWAGRIWAVVAWASLLFRAVLQTWANPYIHVMVYQKL